MIAHGPTVMRDENAPFVRCPRQQVWICRVAKVGLMGGDGIKRWYALPQTTEDYLIEVLIDEQPQHGLLCDKSSLLLL
jgi:hypothetical protein